MDIGEWLRGLGLERYVQAFRDNEIDADILMRRSGYDAEKVEDAFHDALSIARGQQAKSWELRAAMSLAELWAGQGERQKANDLLAPIHDWFTEGFDTPDLKDASSPLTKWGAADSAQHSVFRNATRYCIWPGSQPYGLRQRAGRRRVRRSRSGMFRR